MKIEVKPSSEVPNDPIDEWRKGRESIYPFDTMEINDVFRLPANHNGAGQSANTSAPRVAPAAWAYGRKSGKKFTCKRQKDGGVRVERIA